MTHKTDASDKTVEEREAGTDRNGRRGESGIGDVMGNRRRDGESGL
ncbi:hypothetical protein [Haladaptatus sp. W1]|nr:hypothetical protein [Haladaptatus sp. W1]